MKKLLTLLLFILTTSCAQLNLCSSVVHLTIIKAQSSDDSATMSGSKLDDIAKGISQDAGDATIPVK